MEQKIAPTSPKKKQLSSSSEKNARANTRSLPIGNSIFFFILSLLGGFLAVVVLLTQADNLGISFFTPQESRIVIRSGAEEFSKQEDLRQAFVEEVKPTMLTVYKAENFSQNPETISEALFDQQAYVGHAFFLTSDGIGITTTSVISDPESRYIGMTSRGEFQEIQAIYIDEVSGLSFFQFPGSGFQVIDITDNGSSLPLTPVVTLEENWSAQEFTFYEAPIHFASRESAFGSSEDFFRQAEIATSQNFYPGTPVYQGDGTLLGLISEHTAVTLFTERENVIAKYLRSKSVAYATLGVHGYRLADITYVDPALRQNRTEGFFIADSADGTIQGINSSSPSAQALEDGDIIIRIDNTPITGETPLAELLLAKEPGDTVEVSYVRDSQESSVLITLDKKE